jgi:hypothetical protein
MPTQWIGNKEIKQTDETDEQTPSGSPVVKVTYQDETVEHLSQMMYEKVVSDKASTLEELRDKRCNPVVTMLLSVLNEWGVKLSELSYLSALMNRSLEYNRDQALNKLWGKWMPKPLAPDEVDMLTVDRVLKND